MTGLVACLLKVCWAQTLEARAYVPREFVPGDGQRTYAEWKRLQQSWVARGMCMHVTVAAQWLTQRLHARHLFIPMCGSCLR